MSTTLRCKSCGTVLTDDTWYPSSRKSRNYQCQKCVNIQTLRYQRKHRKWFRDYRRQYREIKKDEISKWYRDYRSQLRDEVLSHYSGTNPPQCANPYGEHDKPYTTIEALALDHINGGGNEERKQRGSGPTFYLWLKKHNFPPGYQILCANCNWIKWRGQKTLK